MGELGNVFLVQFKTQVNPQQSILPENCTKASERKQKKREDDQKSDQKYITTFVLMISKHTTKSGNIYLL
jgi:hypothetical protein